MQKKNSDVLVKIQRDVSSRVRKMLKKNQKPHEIEENLKKSLRNLIFKQTRRNSLIIVQVLEI